MSNVKISQLPEFTGDPAGVYLVMNNANETTSYKVLRETVIGSSGTAGSSGTSGVAGSSGTSGAAGSSGTSGAAGSSGTSGGTGSSGTAGSSGTSGASGASPFALTGSIYNTTNNIGITGSFFVNGTQTITGSINVFNGSNTGSVITNVTDTQSLPRVNFVTTLTDTEYTNLNNSGSLDANTLYLVSGSMSTSGTSGTSGTSAGAGDRNGLINTGSIATTQAITGSLIVSGSQSITGSFQARNGNSKFDVIDMDNTFNGNYVKGVAYYGYTNMFLYADSGVISLTPSTSNPLVRIETGSLFLSSGNVVVTGSAKISNVLSLKPIAPLPSGEPTGSLAVSGSNLFFYNGAWTQII